MRTNLVVNTRNIEYIIDYIVPIIKTNSEPISWNSAIDAVFDDPSQRELRKKQVLRKLRSLGIKEPLATFIGSIDLLHVKLGSYSSLYNKPDLSIVLEMYKSQDIIMQCGVGAQGKIFFLLQDRNIQRGDLIKLLLGYNFGNASAEVEDEKEDIEIDVITRQILDRNSYLEEKLKLVELENMETQSKLNEDKRFAWP